MPTATRPSDAELSLDHPDRFADRHIGPSTGEVGAMLGTLGYPSLAALIDAAVPASIRARKPLSVGAAASEHEALSELYQLAAKNQVFRSYIGCGYYGCVTPPVVLRNVLENPGWYTQYTPYQAEISQGRLEALLNFQTMICDLTGLPVANASLLDEGTAAAEAMALAHAAKADPAAKTFLVAEDCHPQTIAVVRTRAEPLGWTVRVSSHRDFAFGPEVFGALVQYPATDGRIHDLAGLADKAHAVGALLAVAADPLALTLLKPPAELGADVALGSTQRFGVPLGFGGPHAAYFAVADAYKRLIPGRLVGVSKDADGRPALRLALQTREQHIRREKATSNICTAQVLLAVMASMYAVYHGPDGLEAIARRVRRLASALALGLQRLGCEVEAGPFFDTLRVRAPKGRLEAILARARERRINFRVFDDSSVGVSLDETTSPADAADILSVFSDGARACLSVEELAREAEAPLPAALRRSSPFLTHPVFRAHRSETKMLRYLNRLREKDLSLTRSMIPLGSCTMKLNAAAEMLPVTWPEFAGLHPFAPAEQTAGYRELFAQLERWLADITGFAAVSLQPNAGSQGEYAGLLAIRAYHAQRKQAGRDVCLIPQSAHGTNPASAAMAGMRIEPVRCDDAGNIDVADLKAKAEANRDRLAALMVTYPSTHGVFEESIREACRIVHDNGGLVYMDGANLNAQVGLCRPGEIGADVCHLNLHKTFCIPHGGGGPGVGPIGVAAHLAPFLPGHPLVAVGGERRAGTVSAAPWGSAGILVITWMYIRMMGSDGLRRATETAILNANYVARLLARQYPVLYTGHAGLVAHECILDLRPLKAATGVTVEDVAKRLMDYGFHAPTVSFPVVGTLMIEPTESESKEELDRFCEAMLRIREEARLIEAGKLPREDNPLKNAPHTAQAACADAWRRPYSRETAAFPAPWLAESKYWPPVSRIDNPFGDRNLVCSCPPVDEHGKA
ncbi:MAG TPA: aminomethyl-transferring glycine dehydrogenase [Elusimicrobiota bacterium]|nr:aminomethyl-transferring glycine dehydrogenase [Elusimicrobiota bacterium]